MTNHLNDLLTSAKHAQAGIATYDQAGNVKHVIEKRAATVSHVALRAMEMPAFAVDPLRLVQSALPSGIEAGKKVTLDTALIAGSQVAAAGARVIVVPVETEAQSVNGELVFKHRDIRFDLIEPAHFVRVPDGDDIAASALAIHRQSVDIDYMPVYGLRVNLSRAEQRQYAEGQLAASAMASIALGLARLADFVLVQSILYNSPTSFSLGKAAAAGVSVGELRGMVGTAGYGAVMAPSGHLVAVANLSTDTGGILSDLTDTMSETLIGAWQKSAIAVASEISLIADRVNKNGDLTLTAWCGMEALLPRTDVFWKLGA